MHGSNCSLNVLNLQRISWSCYLVYDTIVMQILVFCRLSYIYGQWSRLQTMYNWQAEAYFIRISQFSTYSIFKQQVLCLLQFLLVLVEAWSKVGLRGYHSGQKTVERATMKVHIIFYTRGEKEQRRGERKGRRE